MRDFHFEWDTKARRKRISLPASLVDGNQECLDRNYSFFAKGSLQIKIPFN
jgi:hypothetical protein